MSDGAHVSHTKLYIMVFITLAVLTVGELFIPGMNATWGTRASLLAAVAIIKAFLVAYYFMHLNMETWWMKFIALIPLSAGAYALMVVLESIYR